jgi:membrane protease subunit HflC
MRHLTLVIVLAVVTAVVAVGSLFVVPEGRTALVIELGKVRGEAVGPGLHFKWPVIADVVDFDARVLSWDGDPERIPVKDSKFIFVDTFARWRITEPKRFYNAVRDERGAQSRLDDILDGSVRDVVSTHYLLELVRTTDAPLESGIQEGEAEVASTLEQTAAAADVALAREDLDAVGKRLEVRDRIFQICQTKLAELELGIELVDLRIKRIDYTDQVRDEVFRRMISEQERIAERYRAQGEGRRAEINGGTAQEQKRIESESYRTAEEIKGDGEAESTRLYADAYERDPDFYRFVKTLETYAQILGDDDTLILSTNSDLLRYLKRQR